MIHYSFSRSRTKVTAMEVRFILAIGLLVLLSACNGTAYNSSLSENQARQSKRGILSAYELHKILTDHFGFVSIKLSDAQYRIVDNNKIMQLQNSDCCNPSSTMVKEDWGVDDYAIASMVPMRNYAFGILYVAKDDGSKQVMNVLVNSDKKVVYWDPLRCQYFLGKFEKPDFILF